jgi:hypothetical protein
LREKNASLNPFLNPIEKYVFDEAGSFKGWYFLQTRTVEFTVWADDLFYEMFRSCLEMARAMVTGNITMMQLHRQYYLISILWIIIRLYKTRMV